MAWGQTRALLGVVVLSALAIGMAPCVVAAQGPATSETEAFARSIVAKADEIRFPQEGFQVEVMIVNRSDGQPGDARRYRVLSKGNENTIVMVTEPASERGQIMLLKGRDFWAFLPNVSQPVRLSLAQRLTGQVANGDLARANFTGDYNPVLLRKDEIDGQGYYVLELVAVDRSVTYHRVLYWVHESSYRPLKAEFYSLSNRLLKTCRYERYRMLGGRQRPSRLVMEDALRKGEESVVDYDNLALRDLPDKVFTKDFLKRL